MQIELFEQAEGLHGGKEVWVKVLSNEVMDLLDVKSKLTKEQHEAIAHPARLSGYHPHLVTDEERTDHGYRFEDWFIWSVPA